MMSEREEDLMFESIYELYADELLSYGTGFGFDRETLKDAIQDVFYRLYINRNALANIQNIKYYLFRALKNRLFDIYRARASTDNIENYELDFAIRPTIVDELIEHEDQAIIQQKTKALLDLLTGRQREAIYLRFMQEMEYDEIGELLEMTPQAARKLVFRAMERMRKHSISSLPALHTNQSCQSLPRKV